MGSIRENYGSYSILNGKYLYNFAIYPYTGDWEKADLHKKALEYNSPVPYLEKRNQYQYPDL